MRSLRLSLVAGAIGLFALVPSVAGAQSPAGAGYDETNVVNQLPEGEVLGATSGGGGADVAPESTTPTTTQRESGAGTPASTASEEATEAASGSLPFTGADAGLVALMGAVLLGTGLVLRRNSRSQS